MARKVTKPKAKSADTKPNVSAKKTTSKAKKEEKLTNGYGDTEMEAEPKAAESNEKIDKSSEKDDINQEIKITASKAQVVKSDEEQEIMDVDSVKQIVKQEEPQKVVEVGPSDKPKQTSRKRKSPTKNAEIVLSTTKAKRQKVLLEIPKISSVSGKVFVIGENDVGQLGLGEDVTGKKRPTLLELPYPIIDIAAGGMHSVCLTESGEVITFGCNDEGALGRVTTEEGSEFIPQKVEIPDERIVQVSAGDSHSAALSESGNVYIWGNFRNANGAMGLISDGAKECTPVRILTDTIVVKISSGSDHLVCLSQEGKVYTCGCADVGQLGRFSEHTVEHGDRTGRSMLTPGAVHVGRSSRATFVKNIWTGSYSVFLNIQGASEIYGFGLNNWNQLGLEDEDKILKPKQVTSFNGKQWLEIDGGQHHTLALDDNGIVYSLGRSEYGRLGLGENVTDCQSVPTEIPDLQHQNCIAISSGNCQSFAVTDNGSVYSWGMGTNHQLGHGNDNDQCTPRLIEGNFFNSWKAFKISGGGQHTLILANARESLEKRK